MEKYLEHDHNKTAILNRIYPTEDPHDLKDCDLIIEAVFENVDIKEKVTKETESFMNEKGIFASNTSTLPISILANVTQKPENFIGIHFFSPADKMRLIEIIVGKKTSKETLAKAFDFARQINKTPIIINDSRGFFTSRVFGTFLDEGARLLEEGVNPVKIEHAAKLAGMPIGPLAVSDELSQKLIISIAETNEQLDKELGKATAMNGEASLRVAKMLVEKYNRSGKAYDGGFYEYPEKGKKYLLARIEKTLRHSTKKYAHSRYSRSFIVSSSSRSRPMLRRRRPQLCRRSQHRLHLRHRLPQLHRRHSSIHQRLRPRCLPHSRPRTHQTIR